MSRPSICSDTVSDRHRERTHGDDSNAPRPASSQHHEFQGLSEACFSCLRQVMLRMAHCKQSMSRGTTRRGLTPNLLTCSRLSVLCPALRELEASACWHDQQLRHIEVVHAKSRVPKHQKPSQCFQNTQTEFSLMMGQSYIHKRSSRTLQDAPILVGYRSSPR